MSIFNDLLLKSKQLIPNSIKSKFLNPTENTTELVENFKIEPPTKEGLLRLVDSLSNNPNDRVRVLGDGGIIILGSSLGAASSGTIATVLGGKAAFSMFGWTLAAATPIGWVIGGIVAGGAAAYGISRLIKDGAISEGRKKELLQQYKEQLRDIKEKENINSITHKDKTNFIISMRILIDKDIFSPEDASMIISQVENGQILISDALLLIQNLFDEQNINPPIDQITDDSMENQLNELRYKLEAFTKISNLQERVLLRHEHAIIVTANELVNTAEILKVQERTNTAYDEELKNLNLSMSNIDSILNDFISKSAKKDKTIKLLIFLNSIGAILISLVLSYFINKFVFS